MKNMNTKAKKLEQTSLSKSLNGSNRWSKPNVSGYSIEILNVFAPCKAISHFLSHIHTLRVHNAHAAANLNSGYSKYAKVARVLYFCTIGLRTSLAVLTRSALRRVDLFSKRVIIFLLVIFECLLNLLKCLIYHIIKDKKVCLRRA